MTSRGDTPSPADDPSSLPSRLSRLTGGDPAKTQPKHVRWMAAYGFFATTVLIGINAYSLNSDGSMYPKTIILAPTLFLLSGWMLVDAGALADGRRRFNPGLWTCIAIGSAAGLGIIKALTGRWF